MAENDSKGRKSVPIDIESVESLEQQVTFKGKTFSRQDGDEILQLGLADENLELTPARERRLVRKIDAFLLPVMCLLYTFQFMDKLSNSFASILGLREELNMVGQEYSWTGSAFYLGYLVFELPASYLLQRFPVAKTVSTFIIVWGVVLCLHSVPHNFAGFVTLRTILGALESSVTPAFTFITSQWYTADQTFLRITIWFAFNGMGYIFGSGIAYGLSVHRDSLSIEPWKLVFIITGVLTLALGFLLLFHLPDSPAKAWFLTDEDKALIVHRNRRNQQGFGNKHYKKDQLAEAFTDYKTWLFFVFVLIGNVPNGGITNFGSILLHEQLHYDTDQSLLLQMATGAVELGGCILISSGNIFYNSRFLWATVGQVISSTALCMLALSKNNKVQFVGYVMHPVTPVSFIAVLSCVATNVLGTTKKYTTNVIVLIGYCVGNLVGSVVFKDEEAPEYQTAKKTIAACCILQVLLLLGIWGAYATENKLRDKRPPPEKIENVEFLDLTDKQNPFFRYSY